MPELTLPDWLVDAATAATAEDRPPRLFLLGKCETGTVSSARWSVVIRERSVVCGKWVVVSCQWKAGIRSRSRHISLKSGAGAEVEVTFTFSMGTRPEPKIVRISGAFFGAGAIQKLGRLRIPACKDPYAWPVPCQV